MATEPPGEPRPPTASAPDDGAATANGAASFDLPPPRPPLSTQPFSPLPAERPAAPAPELSAYVIERELNRGGMGVVYLARHRILGRPVALKCLAATWAVTAEELTRFRAEAEAAARLQHPNIVQIYEFGVAEGRPFLAQEYVAGGTLADVLAGGPVPPRAAAEVTATLAAAMDYAHRQEVVHRDLKPANVLLELPPADRHRPKDRQAEAGETTILGAATGVRPSPVGNVKIADFGLAKRLDLPDGPTQTGAILGTPCYMAPEQARGEGGRVGPAADVYALGAVLYELLTGRPPFQAASTLETLEQVRTCEPPPPRRLQPGLPRDLETVCLKCLQKAPNRRYPTAAALADDLRRYLRGEPVLARPVGPLERAAKWARREPAWAALSALALAAAAAAVGGLAAHTALLRAEVERANGNEAAAQTARDRADARYRQARAALEQMLARLNDRRLAEVPRLVTLQQQQREDALAFFLAVADEPGGLPADVRRDVARAVREAATLQMALGRYPDAVASLRRAIALLEALPADRPTRALLADYYSALGGTLDDPGERERLTLQAITLAEQVRAEAPEDPEAREELGRFCNNLGTLYLQLSRPQEAETALRRAVALLTVTGPHDARQTLSLASTLQNLALAVTGRGGAGADPLYKRAADLLENLHRQDPLDLHVADTLGALYLNWGLLAAPNRDAAALQRYDRAIATLTAALGREPDVRMLRVRLAKAHGARASLLGDLKRYPEAVAAWDRHHELAEPAERDHYRILRAEALVRSGDHRRAVAEAEALAPLPPHNLHTHQYLLARICSLALRALDGDAALSAAERPPLAERYTRLGLGYLQRAREMLGPAAWPRWQLGTIGDPDFAPLRSRPGFAEAAAIGQGK